MPSLQAAATRVIGLNETHVSILSSEATRTSFLDVLDKVTPPGEQAVKHAP